MPAGRQIPERSLVALWMNPLFDANLTSQYFGLLFVGGEKMFPNDSKTITCSIQNPLTAESPTDC